MTQLKKGNNAPEFEGADQNGKTIRLKDFQGKKIVLYFYPKDDTPGCTAEACNLRDNFEPLQKSGYEVIGVSPDSQNSHQKFIKKYNLPFNLIADTDNKISNSFGVYGLKKFMGKEYMGINRTTFIIDEKGVIDEVISKVDTKNHTSQIIK